jgi:hypothetical protein
MNNCIGCHTAGGIAPFPLETYEDALAVAPAIGIAVAKREMPPWGADNSGDCNTWEDARWLTDAEIDTITAWAYGDKAAGDPANMPPVPPLAPGLPAVAATVDMGVTYTPNASLSDDYRCFIVDYDQPTEKFLTGVTSALAGQGSQHRKLSACGLLASASIAIQQVLACRSRRIARWSCRFTTTWSQERCPIRRRSI